MKGDPEHAESPDFDDAYWHIVDVPHDWCIEDALDSRNPAGRVGWYRKHFLLPGRYEGQRLFIEFDGVLPAGDVWINGVHLGPSSKGYGSFRYELTAELRQGMSEMNVLAVRVDAAQGAPAGYSGAGICRHVRLMILNPVHLSQGDTVVTTSRLTSGEAVVHVEASVVNQSGAAHVEKVEVYSNCETVELWLNGKSLGSQPRPAGDSVRLWSVPFRPGVLEAAGANGGSAAARQELRTAQKPARILLTADREELSFNWDAVVYLRATVVDEQGVPVPGAKDPITFQGNGAAIFSGVDNGAAGWPKTFRGPDCNMFDGQCAAILKARSPEGVVTVRASAPGLKTSEPVTIRLRPRK